MSRLSLVMPFLIVLSAGTQAPEDNRPPLFFREDWKEIAAATPVMQEHVANPKLQIALYTPASSRVDWIEVYGRPVARIGQAQAGRGDLLRFCPGLGIPCVEITRAAYDRGHDQFRQSCGFCHGPTAAGGNGGPSLLFSSVIRRDSQGADIRKVIQEGRPDKGMPVIPLTPTQVEDIVGYLKARVAEVDKTSGLRPSRDYDLEKLLTGNAELGKAYFNGAGQCATCHSPSGDLKGIATKYPPIELQARLMYPSGVREQATVTDAAGKQFIGELVQQDAFDVTIRTTDGVQRSWPSRSVKVETTDRLAKHRELLSKHSSADMHNLFAYLVALR